MIHDVFSFLGSISSIETGGDDDETIEDIVSTSVALEATVRIP